VVPEGAAFEDIAEHVFGPRSRRGKVGEKPDGTAEQPGRVKLKQQRKAERLKKTKEGKEEEKTEAKEDD
jgi:hypothetical protein